MAKNRVNFATYPQDYYTGAQVRIYFGSVWVDDIATIQYQTSHSKTPLYGYADHQFRAVAKGQFLVRGSFTVAFKEVGYLYNIMKLWREDKSGYDRLKKRDSSTTKGAEEFLKVLGAGATIEQAMDQMKSGSDFEDASEVMENAIWGKPSSMQAFGSRIPRSDELDYFRHIDKFRQDADIDRDGFDILLTFGNYKTGSDSPEHTMISINDVHITGEALVASPSAEPIGITYEFFARGLNEKVSNAWPGPDKIVAQSAEQDKKTEPEKQEQKKSASIPIPSKDITSGDTPDPAQSTKTKEVTQTTEAPKTVGEFVRQTQAAQVYKPQTVDDLMTVATGKFQEIEIKSKPEKFINTSNTKPKSLTKTEPVLPAEIPDVSFNVRVKGNINEAFEKALIAAPGQNVTITGDVINGGTLVKTGKVPLVGTKFEMFNGSYTVYGSVIHIKVKYVLAGQFGIAKNQIIQFFANLK